MFILLTDEHYDLFYDPISAVRVFFNIFAPEHLVLLLSVILLKHNLVIRSFQCLGAGRLISVSSHHCFLSAWTTQFHMYNITRAP